MARKNSMGIPIVLLLALVAGERSYGLEIGILAPMRSWVIEPSSPATIGGSPLGYAQTPGGLPANVTLAWDAPESGEAESYVVEAGTAPGLSNVGVFDTGVRDTSVFVAGVPPGTYYVRVRAKNAAGVSAPSNEIAVEVGSDAAVEAGACGPPAAPAAVTSSTHGATVTVTWARSQGAATYAIEAGSAPGASDLFNGDIGPSPSVSAMVSPGQYFVRVRAKSGCGVSAPSQEITVNVRP